MAERATKSTRINDADKKSIRLEILPKAHKATSHPNYRIIIFYNEKRIAPAAAGVRIVR